MNFLGIDYGRRRIGLAVAVNSIIEPRGWLDWGRDKKKALGQISKICQEEKIDKVIIGIVEGIIGREVKTFVRRLTKMLKLPIDFVDETLTSWEAERMVGVKNKGRVDSVSAALILQRYIEFRI